MPIDPGLSIHDLRPLAAYAVLSYTTGQLFLRHEPEEVFETCLQNVF